MLHDAQSKECAHQWTCHAMAQKQKRRCALVQLSRLPEQQAACGWVLLFFCSVKAEHDCKKA
jgi:hypothetical protein